MGHRFRVGAIGELRLKIDFVSDVACPWCAVGLYSLEEALRRIGPTLPVELHFQPFELNPQMPPEGEDTIQHLSRKYGASPAQLAQTRETLRQRGAEVGFTSVSGRACGTPSTRTACCTGPASKGASAS